MRTPENTRAAVLEKLGALGIEYELLEHAPVRTIEDCRPIDRHFGAPVAKNLFLRNRAGTAFFLLTMRGEKPFRTAEISRQIGSSRLSFAEPEMLMEYLGTLPGAISPLGAMFDAGGRVRVLLDEGLRGLPRLVVHPCVNTASLSLRAADLTEVFFPAVGHAPAWVRIE